MIRLTVLYNLPDTESVEDFLDWRLTEHQRNNESMDGVQRTDFARIIDSWSTGSGPDYQFQTIAEWPDRESFEASFYSEDSQSALKENLKRLGDYTFFISDIVTAPES